jgi:type II secretory pathway pseudopilin PulG
MPELARKLGEPMPGDDNEIVQLYGRMGSNLYWLEQDGWLLLSGVPQPLMDRLTLGADQSIAALLERAGTDGNALVTMATSTRDVPRQAYHVWLSLLETLGDLAQSDLDLTQLPTATQLGLPRDTAMSVVLDASATRLNLELNYSTHPLEWLSGTDAVTTVAVMGVLAAVAIPAYQDYELRAEVANTLMLAAPLKTAIAEYVAAKGELPGSAEQLGMELPLSSADDHASVDLDQGAIVIRFADSAPANLAGTYLYLLPTGADGVLSGWVCGYAASSAQDLLISMDESIPPSDIQSRYLPQTCK